jgi:hypothetical protein
MEELFRNRAGARAVFEEVDRMLARATASVPMLASSPGFINLGLDELATALENQDSRCIFGSGSGYGPNRAEAAARAVLESPLVAYHGAISFARTVIVHIAGGDSLSLTEIRTVMENIRAGLADEEVNIFFGTTVKPHLGDEIRVTLIASINADEFKTAIETPPVPERIPTQEPQEAPAEVEEEVPGDDLYTEDIMNSNFEVVALDYCAYSVDAYSMLSSFAFNFSGMVDDEFNMVSHLTGYNSEKYNAIIEAIYYLPFYNSISAKDYSSFMMYESEEAFQAVLDSVNAVYNEYGINLAKPEDARATLLHKAEEVLMQEMPVIPVVFNKNATLTSKSIKNVETDYYTDYKFEGTTLKNYEAFLVHFEEYVYAAKKIK